MQAASPAFETARLLALVGVGIDTLRGFGALLIASAGLSVFIALWNAMQERRYDLAVLRTARRLARRAARPAAARGAAAGRRRRAARPRARPRRRRAARPPAARRRSTLGLSGLVWLPEELYVVLLALAVGVLAALLPAVQAYRTDIAAVLATR